MTPTEIAEALVRAISPLGKDARAYIGLSATSVADRVLYVCAENTWRPDADKFTGHAVTFEDAIAQIEAWVSESHLRNRVATAADLGIAA